jgi:hypothetical protein
MAVAMFPLRARICPATRQESAMPEVSDSPSSSRALVPLIPLKPQSEAPHHGPTHRIASFITHLIATSEKLPQTRQKRRADPADVIAAYQATVSRLRQLNNQ